MSGRPLEQFGFPPLNREEDFTLDREMLRETSYDEQELQGIIKEHEPKLTSDQRAAMEKVMASVRGECEENFLFLNASGGTGKTYLTNLILAKVRLGGNVALAVASSGIAATLLVGGRTAHALFKLPLNLATNIEPMCNIRKTAAWLR